MKETFVDHNYTQKDVNKSLFKEQWIRTASVNGNVEKKKMVMRTSTMLGGGGMPYPGVSKPVYVIQEDEEKA